ncbi:MAG: biopolymer transporter ExbD, partial [Candidatus Sumerlaeia bacterium]|nr:biopolymer transporter ExbD [Candidatus Sumerlaeia bacterium]
IELTSLLEVTLVLLIAFMVVAPALRYNVDLELPKVGEGAQESKQKPVTVQVKAPQEGSDPEIHVNGDLVAFEGLVDRIKSIDGFSEDSVISFEADRRVEWGHTTRIINELKLRGIEKLAIVTERGG